MELKPMTDKKSLPPNIKEFNEISTIILGEVYKSHPHPVTIDPARIATILGVAPSEKLPSGRTFSDMFAHTIAWLAREGVLSDLAAVVPHRATLTAKTLAAMRGTIGSQFIDAAAEGSSKSGSGKIAELMGSFLGAFTGSYVKSVSGS